MEAETERARGRGEQLSKWWEGESSERATYLSEEPRESKAPARSDGVRAVIGRVNRLCGVVVALLLAAAGLVAAAEEGARAALGCCLIPWTRTGCSRL